MESDREAVAWDSVWNSVADGVLVIICCDCDIDDERKSVETETDKVRRDSLRDKLVDCVCVKSSVPVRGILSDCVHVQMFDGVCENDAIGRESERVPAAAPRILLGVLV